MFKSEMVRNEKVVALQQLMANPPLAIGGLILLWDHAVSQASDQRGPIYRDLKRVGLVARQPDPEQFGRAALDAGLIDPIIDDDGSTQGYVVHDLWDHCSRMDKERIRKRIARKSPAKCPQVVRTPSAETADKVRTECGRSADGVRTHADSVRGASAGGPRNPQTECGPQQSSRAAEQQSFSSSLNSGAISSNSSRSKTEGTPDSVSGPVKLPIAATARAVMLGRKIGGLGGDDARGLVRLAALEAIGAIAPACLETAAASTRSNKAAQPARYFAVAALEEHARTTQRGRADCAAELEAYRFTGLAKAAKEVERELAT